MGGNAKYKENDKSVKVQLIEECKGKCVYFSTSRPTLGGTSYMQFEESA